MELKRFDSSLIDLYINDPREEYIEKYWSGQSYIKESPKWEYLLEGTIEITNQNERFDLCSYVEKNYPSDYDSIVRANGNEWWRSGGGFDE